MAGVPLLNDFSVKLQRTKTLEELDDDDVTPWWAAKALVKEVAITIASMPDAVAGSVYELVLTADGYGDKEWQQIGDTVTGEVITTRPSDGALVWRVPVVPAAGTKAIKFRCTNGITTDDADFTWTILSGATAPDITSTTLASIIVGQPAVIPITATGTPPFTIERTAGAALPAGVTFPTTAVQSFAVSAVEGSALPGSEGAGASTTWKVTGPGGNDSQVFASGITVNRLPEITNEGTIQIPPGSSGSFQLTAVGYPAPTFAKDAGETWPTGITIDSAGLIEWTDQTAIAGTTTGNFRVTATNSVGADTANVKFQVLISANNAPPVSATYWADAEAGLATSGNLIDTWADQQAALSLSSATYNKPSSNDTNKSVDFIGGSSSRTNLAAGGAALSLPWFVAARVWIPSGISDGIGKRVFHDTSGDPRIVYNDNGANQHRIVMVVGGTTVNGTVDAINRGAWNDIACWVNSDGSYGIAVNGVDATGGAGSIGSPAAWAGLIMNGTTDTTSFDMKIHRWYAKSGSVPDSTQRAQIRTWLQANWNGTTPPPPDPLDIPDEVTDSRTLGAFVPARIGANDTTWVNGVVGNVEWHSPRTGMTFLQGQRSYWEGDARYIPRAGLTVNAAGYNTLSLRNSVVQGLVGKQVVRNQINNTVPPYQNNGAAGRARLRLMTKVKIRTSQYPAVAPTKVIACCGFVFDDDMINNTDVRQAILGLGHTSSQLTGGNGTPANAPGLFIGKEDPATTGRLYFSCQQGSATLGSAATIFSELKDILAADTVKVPQVGVPYFFVFRYQLSYQAEGYTQCYMRSPAHFGGVVTKVYERFGGNYYNDPQGDTPTIGPQTYHWDRAWTAPRLSHGEEVLPFVAFTDTPGTPTLSVAMMFDWMDARLDG